ncbi:MAG TPA: alpha/beta fold hydrolase [Bryobacteraceae bacterium]|nr:alpha/beta fold hydrolase [Bryobacteraceae bacterium]
MDYIIAGGVKNMSHVRPFDQENISGFLHEPATDSRGGIALTHGAGANCNSRLLIAVAELFCVQNWTVLRYDLPFRRNRPSGPPWPRSAALDQAGVCEAAAQLRALTRGPIVAAGHSYGGRQTTMIAAKQPDFCDAIMALSYPLHPPNKPDQLRTVHFPELQVPVLFVQGSTDPFGTEAEMQEAIKAIPSQTRLVIIERGSHDLKNGKIEAGKASEIVKQLEELLPRRD